MQDLKEISYLLKKFNKQFYTVMSIDGGTGNDPMRQQRLSYLTCFKCNQKGNYRKDCPNSTGTSPVPDQSSSMPTYSPLTMVTQTVTLLCCTLV